MPLSVLVTNQPPETDANVPEPVKDLFQAYGRVKYGEAHVPFSHQAEVFRRVLDDQEIFLVAGTAAGKTLAIAVPLFHKLREGRIRKILLMYPTIALMEDQRGVMDTLAEITGMQIGQLQGGMSHTEMIAALNKPVILATPDEIYWFFRKNVKYSGLLIYGLALVDEFVLDEAHLFNGLMLRNLTHFKHRVGLLGERLGRHPRWHILTATPTAELHHLTSGAEVRGHSKCSDVEVTFLDPATGYEDRQNKLISAVDSALIDGAQKVLLVFNSADLAHRVFEGIKGRSRPDLPPDLQWQFGRIPWGSFQTWLKQEGIPLETVEEIERWLHQEGPFYLKDLDEAAWVDLSSETLIAKVARLLEGQTYSFRHLLYSLNRDGEQHLIDAIDRQLGSKEILPRLLWNEVRSKLQWETDINVIVEALEARMSLIQAGLERLWAEESLRVTAPGCREITESLQEIGVSPELAEAITRHLKHMVELPEQSAVVLRKFPRKLAERRVALSWLEWLVQNSSRRQILVDRVHRALAEQELEVEARHVAVWGDTGVPVIIYTGKMSRAERQGLIDAFRKLPRAALISTPAVEVGVDFAADILITEQCDSNSFLQRFGRVGRHASIMGKVMVLVSDGEIYVRLFRCHRPQMSREEFSALIADPADGLFPSRLYAEGSAFLDATHWMVNAQLGEIGGWLNQAMFGNEVPALGRKLREANLPFACGLRGSLPEIALRNGTGGGDPFYILRKVSNERLLASDSPFEAARADMSYLEFLWKKPGWETIVVDTEATLKSSQAFFWWQDGQWHVRAGSGIAADYVRLFHPVIKPNLQGLEEEVRKDLTGFLARFRPYAANPKVRPILQVGEALSLFFEPQARFILGYGDVHLLRVDMEGTVDAVEDYLGNPLVLSDQIWLILYGHTREVAEKRLKEVLALGLEEVIYDWNTLQVPGSLGPVLLDRISGACFHVYRRLVDHACR